MKALDFKRLHPNATLPKQQKEGDAGFDLAVIDVYGLSPNERLLVDTGVAVAIPPGFVGLVRDRSGVASKKGVEVMAGVIDESFRGHLKVLLHNTSSQMQWFNSGDRVAQLVVVPYLKATSRWVDDLGSTDRGEDGFGSSGE